MKISTNERPRKTLLQANKEWGRWLGTSLSHFHPSVWISIQDRASEPQCWEWQSSNTKTFGHTTPLHPSQLDGQSLGKPPGKTSWVPNTIFARLFEPDSSCSRRTKIKGALE
ncbi:hypothetical protein ABW19_dt0208259 [Dactylella cylindrospora]|nr:hypothetical protein ABW19_dt0208259 [Dactylella cylindrospora]